MLAAALSLALLAPLPVQPTRPTGPAVAKPADGVTGPREVVEFGAEVDLRHQRRAPSPVVHAMLVATLRRFVDGTDNPTAIDKAVARRLGKLRSAKTSAKRILAALDAMPPARKSEAFGGGSTHDGFTPIEWTEALAAGAGLVHGGIGIGPTDSLPAESLPKPTSYDVNFSGVSSTAATDADGADELVVMASFVRVASQSSYETVTTALPASGAIEGLGAGTNLPQSLPVLTGAKGDARLAITAAFEADGNTDALREDYATMLALADVMAVQAEGATTLAAFEYGLDYTLGLLHLANPTQWPEGTVQRTLLKDDLDLYHLWATPAQTTNGIGWKLRHDHAIGDASYSVYFDVPSPAVAMPTLKVQISAIESLDSIDQDGSAADLEVRVKIGAGDGKTKTLSENKDKPSVNWTVQRQITDAPHTIVIEVYDLSPPPAFGSVQDGPYGATHLCGNWGGVGNYPPCPPEKTRLVLRGDGDTSLDIQYDPKTKKLSGDVVGDAGATLTKIGSGGKRGKIKFKLVQLQ